MSLPKPMPEDEARQRRRCLEELIFQADENLNVRLEFVNGVGIWEASPVRRHQKAVDRIRASIKPLPQADGGCECVHYYDLAIAFPDGSFKRPDISIFCREPDEEDESVTLLPEAVVEIISRGHEKKDIEIGVPFYVSQGIRDVVLFEPRRGEVTHVRADGETKHRSPVTLTMECGCICTF